MRTHRNTIEPMEIKQRLFPLLAKLYPAQESYTTDQVMEALEFMGEFS